MTILIVGAGQAGGECASQLRKLGHPGPITLLGDEPHPPYKRPPLSKAYLAGAATAESLQVLPAASLEKANIAFRGGVRVMRIDRAGRQVELASGEKLAYDKLLLATGGRARELNLPGARRANVLPLRTIADVDAIKPRLAPGRRVCIVGGGFIGLEVAAVCVKLGARVTVLEGLPRVLARVTAAPVSAFFERIHREAGVDLRIGAQVAALQGEPEVAAVVLADGASIETDLVIVGVGIVPNVELAQDAGLAVDNGIVVDEFTRTSDPDICAAGDCSNHPSEFAGRRLRLESVQNAMEQGRGGGVARRPPRCSARPSLTGWCRGSGRISTT